ncbi:MAG: pyridoxamine 5'-phosphate oxidase [Bacteroidota bacterium]
MEVFGHLESIQEYIWQQLGKAPHQKRHSWRTAVIANLVNGQRVLQRTVVLRKASASSRLLRFYTDTRSTKIQPLPKNDAFSWLFYDERKQIQLRAQTRARLITGDEAAEIWTTVNPYTFKDYASISAPGTPQGTPEGYYPAQDQSALEEAARQNFGVLDCVVEEMEFLQLHRQGHRRAQFFWEKSSQGWKGEWLVP